MTLHAFVPDVDATTVSFAVPAQRFRLPTRAGEVAIYAEGRGDPVLLLHSVNAAASSFEVRPIFERLVANRRVYALDLPGFGASERQARPYRIEDFVDAIETIGMAAARESASGALGVVALSLSAEFAAAASAALQPWLRRLALITPTGFDKASKALAASVRPTREIPGVETILRLPYVGDAAFAALTSRPSISFFLRRTFGSPNVPQSLIDYACETARHPNAKHAVFSFASGALFSGNPQALYDQIQCPVWLAHGEKGAFRDFSNVGWLRTKPNWTMTSFPTGALPHFEHPEPFFARLEDFLTAPN